VTYQFEKITKGQNQLPWVYNENLREFVYAVTAAEGIILSLFTSNEQ